MATFNAGTIRWMDPLSIPGQRLIADILYGHRVGPRESCVQTEQFISELTRRGLQLLPIAAVPTSDGRLTGALGVISPGRVSMVFLPDRETIHDCRQGLTDSLKGLLFESDRRGLALVQSLTDPDDQDRALLLAAAEFDRLATLCFCERPHTAPLPTLKQSFIDSFIAYPGTTDAEFGAVLEQTYIDSLDCPRLNGVRRTEDIIAGHKSCGEHDPSLWFMALSNGEPAGLLLLSPIPDTRSLEIVYMGVVPRWRGKGVGEALLLRAHQICDERRFDKLTLAVDKSNSRAWALYHRWGFAHVGDKDAWILVLHG